MARIQLTVSADMPQSQWFSSFVGVFHITLVAVLTQWHLTEDMLMWDCCRMQIHCNFLFCTNLCLCLLFVLQILRAVFEPADWCVLFTSPACFVEAGRLFRIDETRHSETWHNYLLFLFNFHSCDLYQYVTVVALAYFRLAAFTEVCGS